MCKCVCFFKKKDKKSFFFLPIFGYYMSLREVRKCKLFRKGQLLKILTFYFDKFTNIFIFWRNEAHKYFCILRNKHTHTQGRGKGVLIQKHTTTPLKSHGNF